MGSSWSGTTSHADSFSIDSKGNIHRKSSEVTHTADTHKSTSEESNIKTDNNDSREAPTTPIDEANSFIVPPKPVVVVVTNPKQSSEGLSLKEADSVISNLKSKYKPEARDMAGVKRTLFEQVERNLVQCYAANKHQSLNCESILHDYKNQVEVQRRQMLKKFTNVPLLTTVLVIVTCLLLHITTISCYGAMSIDLGSEWMKVGLVAPSVQMDIVLNAASQRKTPMAIAFSNGERFIGDTALDVASKYPERTYTHFLDLVGKTINDESVQQYKRRFPYADIKSHEPNSTSIVLNHPEGLSFTPLELIAMMIQHAHDQVTNRLNSNEPTYDVVITVPPFFNSVEKKVIRDAARLIGLNVLRLTNVNSAFALSYGIFRHKDYQAESSDNKTTILFFDQGASQTSATLADYHLVEQFDEATGLSRNESLPTVTIRAQVYDRYLGGFDMQLKLRDHLVEAFSKSTNIDRERIYKRGRSSAKVLKESGRVKKVLSANTEHLVRVENVIDDKDLRQPISRREFEDLNRDLLETKIIQLLDRLFEQPGVSRDERLESVIIVGGNTRTPKVQQVLLEYFKLDSLGKSINSDEGAALAALYQAASLGKGFRVKKFLLEEFGDEKKRFDPTAAAAIAALKAAEAEAQKSKEASNETSTGSTTPASIEQASETTSSPESLYSVAELDRINAKLAQLREHDFLVMQRLSLRNSLESLLSEAREKLSDDDEQLKDKKEEIEKLLSETYIWLEDGPQEEKDNVTTLADKFHSIHMLVHPPPPPPPPPSQPTLDPSTLDLSNVLNNETLSFLDALKEGFSNPFGQYSNGSKAAENDTKPVETSPEPDKDSSTTTPKAKPTRTAPHPEL